MRLSETAVSDPNPDVRKSAVASVGEFGENGIIGLLSYILLNDPDETVRVEAAKELGKLHHPYSLDVLAQALKDKSALVRKEAIEGLKNIKKMTKKREIIEENNIEESESEEIIQESSNEDESNDLLEEDVDDEEEASTNETEPLKEVSDEEKDFYKL